MFKPIKTQRINDNFYTIRTGIVNFYVYDTGKELVVFDAGMNKQLCKLGFRRLNLDYDKVTHVFLTHSDFDHTAGLKLFKDAKLFISKNEEPLITGRKARRGFIYNKRIKSCNFIEDGEEIKIGDLSIKVISTPGHTIGSMMYIINDNILITGDTISLSKDGIVKSFSIVQNMNHKKNIETVNRLKEENLFEKMSLIATGHHGIITKH